MTEPRNGTPGDHATTENADANEAVPPADPSKAAENQPPKQPSGERGGPKGPEPTRFGDWEKDGRCFDF
ncbi:MAG: DUF1674 domain-containing protein [Pseudomonadota bacterium]